MQLPVVIRASWLGGLLLLAACGGRSGPEGIAPDARRADQIRQQTIALRNETAQQSRLDDIVYPLLRSAIPFCGNSVGYRPGFRFLNIAAYSKNWVDAARQIGMTDTLRVATITRGGPADRAGLRVGDRIVQIAGRPAPVGRNAMRDFAEYLDNVPRNENAFVSLTVIADTSTATRAIAIPQEQSCSFSTVAVADEARTAWADGPNIFVTSSMMRYAMKDDDLAVVLAHQLAHNAANHAGSRRRNSTIGAILGAAVDIAAGSQGVNTQGLGSGIGQGAGARAFSAEHEREADYLALYILARADMKYENASPFWRRVADEKPGTVRLTEMHQTSPERLNRLDQAVLEVDRKKANGQPLLPNNRK